MSELRRKFGKVLHRYSPYLNSRLEQDDRGIQQRYDPMLRFESLASASRFCHAFEEVRSWFRPRQHMTQPVSLAAKRRLFMERFTALRSLLMAA